MGNLNVTIVAPQGYAKELGKKSTTSDITFYDNKKGEATVSIIEPSRYPEKLSSLFFAASLGDMALIVVEKLDSTFGESVVMIDSVGIKKGFIVLKNYLTIEQLAPLLKGTSLESFEVLEDNPTMIREKLMAEAERLPKDEPPADIKIGSVPIDHFFDVKGVGTVILGTVAEGVVRRHDKLKALPGTKTAEVRSIQKHDDDSEWSVKGDRVGFALKSIEATDVDRGMVLTSDPQMKTASTISAKANLVKFWPSPIKEGMVLHIGHWTQFLNARVESVKADQDWRRAEVVLKLEKDVVFLPGSKGVLCYLDGGKLRVMGTVPLG